MLKKPNRYLQTQLRMLQIMNRIVLQYQNLLGTVYCTSFVIGKSWVYCTLIQCCTNAEDNDEVVSVMTQLRVWESSLHGTRRIDPDPYIAHCVLEGCQTYPTYEAPSTIIKFTIIS